MGRIVRRCGDLGEGFGNVRMCYGWLSVRLEVLNVWLYGW